MPLGLTGKFDILQHSPHDQSAVPPALEAAPAKPTQHWVPSRYNVRATADDGRLVLWNSLSGKISVFKNDDREPVLNLLHRKGFVAPKEKVVKYLADRGFLIREGTDEFRVFQQKFGEAHYRTDALELILMSSEDCNFRCKYCYEDFARGTMTPEVREGVKNLVRQRIKKLNRLHISWFGGEPLYGMEALEDLAPFFIQIADEHNVPFGSNMTTNAYLLTPDIQDKLFEWRIRHFQITLDGLPEHHDHSRVARDGSPTFARIFENLQALARRPEKFHVMLRVNFDQVNAGGLSQFVDLLSESFKDDPRFHLALRAVGKWGGDNDANLAVCGADESATIVRDIMAQAKRQGLHFGSLRDGAKMGSGVCYAARPYNFLIGATGKVMKCTIVLDKQDYNVVGHLAADGKLTLDDDRMALWTEPAYEQDGQCRKCVVLPNCQGISCPLIRIEEKTQPCISARSNPKGELLGILQAPNLVERQIAVG
jgi:uncharacterized protein